MYINQKIVSISTNLLKIITNSVLAFLMCASNPLPASQKWQNKSDAYNFLSGQPTTPNTLIDDEHNTWPNPALHYESYAIGDICPRTNFASDSIDVLLPTLEATLAYDLDTGLDANNQTPIGDIDADLDVDTPAAINAIHTAPALIPTKHGVKRKHNSNNSSHKKKPAPDRYLNAPSSPHTLPFSSKLEARSTDYDYDDNQLFAPSKKGLKNFSDAFSDESEPEHSELATKDDAKDQSYACGIDGCTYTANKKRYLTKHMIMHTDEKPFKCGAQGCTYAANHQSYVTSHQATRHIGREKLFTCNVEGCTFTTAYQNSLIGHIRRHTGEKLFKCEHERCDYETYDFFAFKKHKNQHYKNQHSEQDRPFKCPCEGCIYKAKQKKDIEDHFYRKHNLNIKKYNKT